MIFLTHKDCIEYKIDVYGRRRSSRHQHNGVLKGGVGLFENVLDYSNQADQWLHFRSYQNKGTGEMRLGGFAKLFLFSFRLRMVNIGVYLIG